MREKFISHAKRLNPPAVTLSGGDPLHKNNYEEILNLCKVLRSERINIWLYTGYTLLEIKSHRKEILDLVDVIVDGKYEDSLTKNKPVFAGSSNQKINRSPFV